MVRRRLTLALFGDSIADGLGVRGASYGDVLASLIERSESVDVAFHRFTSTAKMIHESRRDLERCAATDPDVVILAHGVTEAVVRPHERHLKYLPQRWRKPGWMDPRPYYSSRPLRRLPQKLESGLRWRVRAALVRGFGGGVWMPTERFESETREFIRTLLARTDCHLLIIPPFAIDERFFPRTPESFTSYAGVLARLGDGDGRVSYLDLSRICRVWDDFFDDHFHPNHAGHMRIAEALHTRMLESGVLGRTRLKGVAS